jgi:hypothetical protein
VGAAGAGERRVPEGQVPELAACAGGSGDGLAVDDQHTADAHLRGEVQDCSGIGRGGAAGLGDPRQGGVVADQQRKRRARTGQERCEVYLCPSEGAGLHELAVLHRASNRDRDDPQPPAVSSVRSCENRANVSEHGLGRAIAMGMSRHRGDDALQVGEGHLPAFVPYVDGRDQGSLPAAVERHRRSAPPACRDRSLVEQCQSSKAGGDLRR